MRAPPVALKQTYGTPYSRQALTPRTNFSPTTLPIEPPMKLNSNADATSGMPVGRSTSNMWILSYRARIVPSAARSEEHTSELQSLMRISYAVFCLKKKNNINQLNYNNHNKNT